MRLIARRHVAGVVRSKRRNPYAEHPLPGETLDLRCGDGPGLEHRIEARERLDHMLEHVRQRLDERGLLLFELLYVQERSIEDACAATGMTRDAVYAWRSRLKRQLEGSGSPADDIAASVGYDNPAFFRRLFKRSTGLTPGAYRRMFQPLSDGRAARTSALVRDRI